MKSQGQVPTTKNVGDGVWKDNGGVRTEEPHRACFSGCAKRGPSLSGKGKIGTEKGRQRGWKREGSAVSSTEISGRRTTDYSRSRSHFTVGGKKP